MERLRLRVRFECLPAHGLTTVRSQLTPRGAVRPLPRHIRGLPTILAMPAKAASSGITVWLSGMAIQTAQVRAMPTPADQESLAWMMLRVLGTTIRETSIATGEPFSILVSRQTG